jgi:hypothetical protein
VWALVWGLVWKVALERAMGRRRSGLMTFHRLHRNSRPKVRIGSTSPNAREPQMNPFPWDLAYVEGDRGPTIIRFILTLTH